MSVMVVIVLHTEQSSELFDMLKLPKDTRVKRHVCDICYVQSKRFSKCKKELATETFDTNSAAFAKPFSVFEMEIIRSQKLLFLSGVIVSVSRVCIEKYSSFYRAQNETCLF